MVKIISGKSWQGKSYIYEALLYRLRKELLNDKT